jgi:hypothetical protein
MKLRYYGDSSMAADHRVVVARLDAVHRKWGIPVAVERVRERHGPIEEFPGPVRDADVETVYDRDFLDNPLLGANVGHDPGEAFSTDNGLPTIAGTVGIVEPDPDGLLLWATLLSGEPPGRELFSADAYSVGFLDEVLEDGPEVLERKCASADDVTPPAHLAGDGEVPDDLRVDDGAPTDRSGTDAADTADGVVGDATRRELARIIGEDRRDGDRDATGRAGADTPAPAAGDDPFGDDRRGLDGRRSDEDLLAEFVAGAPAMADVDQEDVSLGVSVGDLDGAEGLSAAERSVTREFGTRTADAVVRGDRHWVVRTAHRLSAVELDRALGEVLVVDALYRDDEALAGDETVRAVLFDTPGRADGEHDGLELLADTVEYAAAMGVELFVRDPSIEGGLFRRLTDYGSTPASVSIDSTAR